MLYCSASAVHTAEVAPQNTDQMHRNVHHTEPSFQPGRHNFKVATASAQNANNHFGGHITGSVMYICAIHTKIKWPKGKM